MLSSRLFWKIFSVTTAVTLISAGMVIWFLAFRQSEMILSMIDQRLRVSTTFLQEDLTPAFTTGGSPELQKKLQKLQARTGTRITLVAFDGQVLGDSAEDPQVMDFHADRQEIRQAIKTGTGSSQRWSHTLKKNMRYSARRIGPAKSPLGVVRVALPVEQVDLQVTSYQQVIWITATVCSLVSLFFTCFLVGRLLKPLQKITAAAKAMTSGKLRQEVHVSNHDELGTLADAFNTMSRHSASRFEELRKKSRELAENSDRLSAVLGSMIEGVIAIDSAQRILFVNRAAQKMLDLPSPDLTDCSLTELVRITQLHELVDTVLTGYCQASLEFRLPGNQTVIAAFGTPLPGENCPGALLVLHDVSGIRQLENMRAEFFSNVSHELKTPLTAIQAYAETLLEGALNDPEHNLVFVGNIVQQSERLHGLIVDMMHLSRIESGTDVFEIDHVDIQTVLNTCLKSLAPHANSKNIQLAFENRMDHPSVMADPEGLRTIFENLIDNAIKYTPAGGTVIVSCRAENRTETECVLVEVKDTGIGIPEEYQTRVFERFYRVDKARSRELGGTGLGLSIVKHLSQVFGATLELDSQPQKGSTFRVIFPLASPLVKS